MNDFNDWQIRAAPGRLRGTALLHGEPRKALEAMPMASSLPINELVDKTRNAVDRTARAYGRL